MGQISVEITAAPGSLLSGNQHAKLNDVDPQAWLADVLARIAEHPARKLDELLPWNWQQARRSITA